MAKLRLTAIGISTGVVIPNEILARLGVAKGDALYVTETPDGGYRLTSHDPGFADRMAQADDIMHRYHNTLRSLAQ